MPFHCSGVGALLSHTLSPFGWATTPEQLSHMLVRGQHCDNMVVPRVVLGTTWLSQGLRRGQRCRSYLGRQHQRQHLFTLKSISGPQIVYFCVRNNFDTLPRAFGAPPLFCYAPPALLRPPCFATPPLFCYAPPFFATPPSLLPSHGQVAFDGFAVFFSAHIALQRGIWFFDRATCLPFFVKFD